MNKVMLRGILVIAALVSIMAGSTSAYFSDSKVISGNVFTTGTWSTIVINEVYYLGNKEWIELYNAGNTTVDIKGWSICNSTDCGKLSPEKKAEIPVSGYVLISHDANDLKSWDISKEAVKIFYAGGKKDFNDNGDSVMLKDVHDNVIDQMTYQIGATADLETFSRIPNGTDTNQNTDFKAAIATPAKPNY